ncbi:hypothetical protein [uncultured Sphingomonas sp.]|uniref:hypothetical protein n=1 Tax=uncultured Sphingomonas sp. TaxID=158754 RepID=UPI00259194EB|nr:hypothetical protein [uncultured Sphingomonas sp.]
MRRLARYALDWAGDMAQSPHGDWVSARDADDLQDELERAKAKSSSLAGELVALRAQKAVEKPIERRRMFGYVNPDDARSFLSGSKESCRVFKRKADTFCMPLANALGPNHYQKPPLGTVVTVLGGLTMRVVSWTDAGLLVQDAFGNAEEVDKWSWKR